VRVVEDVLIVGVGVDGRHETALDPEGVVDGLGHGSQAVRRAGRVRDDVVLRRVVVLVVHTHHDGDVLALRRCGDDHLLGAGREMLSGALGVREEARRLHDDVCPDLRPRQVGRITLGENRKCLAINDDLSIAGDDIAAETAKNAVVLE